MMAKKNGINSDADLLQLPTKLFLYHG